MNILDSELIKKYFMPKSDKLNTLSIVGGNGWEQLNLRNCITAANVLVAMQEPYKAGDKILGVGFEGNVRGPWVAQNDSDPSKRFLGVTLRLPEEFQTKKECPACKLAPFDLDDLCAKHKPQIEAQLKADQPETSLDVGNKEACHGCDHGKYKKVCCNCWEICDIERKPTSKPCCKFHAGLGDGSHCVEPEPTKCTCDIPGKPHSADCPLWVDPDECNVCGERKQIKCLNHPIYVETPSDAKDCDHKSVEICNTCSACKKSLSFKFDHVIGTDCDCACHMHRGCDPKHVNATCACSCHLKRA